MKKYVRPVLSTFNEMNKAFPALLVPVVSTAAAVAGYKAAKAVLDDKSYHRLPNINKINNINFNIGLNNSY